MIYGLDLVLPAVSKGEVQRPRRLPAVRAIVQAASELRSRLVIELLLLQLLCLPAEQQLLLL